MGLTVTKLTPEEIKACKDLGFNSVVHQTDLKKKYRELALEHHPDKGGDVTHLDTRRAHTPGTLVQIQSPLFAYTYFVVVFK